MNSISTTGKHPLPTLPGHQELERILIWSALFSCALVLMRIFYTEGLIYLGMIWNLFLGAIPYFLSRWLTTHQRTGGKRGLFFCFFIPWLVFIPNAFYMMTDLFHLSETRSGLITPAWFDLVLVLSFAWNGLILGVLSIRQMEKIWQKHFGWKHEVLFLYPLMCLNALGIYIGRYLRYNSWDIVWNPLHLLRDMAILILHPLAYPGAWSMIFCFSVLMTLMYNTLKKLGRVI